MPKAAIISRISLIVLFLLCETLICDAKPGNRSKPQWIKNDTSIVSCPDIIPENIQRLQILDIIRSGLTPLAITLKEKTTSRINLPWMMPYLDKAPVLVGFPFLDTEGNCSICNKINPCFRVDCEPLGNLMILINNLMSSMYSKDTANITRELYSIRSQMNCDPSRISKYQEEWQRIDIEYRIAKDIIEFADALQSRYANIYFLYINIINVNLLFYYQEFNVVSDKKKSAMDLNKNVYSENYKFISVSNQRTILIN